MSWDYNTTTIGDFGLCTNTASSQTITFAADTNTTDLWVYEPLINWLPYKWKKYIPTWHLVKSYNVNKFDVILTKILIENSELFERMAREEYFPMWHYRGYL